MSKAVGSRFAALLVCGLWFGLAVQASACPVCIAYPQKSAADYLIEATCVVLAREDPARPFSHAPIETLKGKFDGEPIDLFLDSTTRRMLAADPQRSAVLVQDGEGGWRTVGLASRAYEAVVRRIVLRAPEWEGVEGRPRRVEFFLPLFGHEDPLIRDLAYLEMARAPYAAIRQLSRAVPREVLEPLLRNRQYVEWRSLAILILAQDAAEADRRYISKSFRAAARYGLTTNLAAWAAAAIELQGTFAVAFIEEQYFRQADREPEELREVLKALSLHGTEGRTELRERIVAGYGTLLEVHPGMAARVAADLLAWKRFELTAQLAKVEATAEDLDYSDKQTIRRYLRVAASSQTAQVDD